MPVGITSLRRGSRRPRLAASLIINYKLSFPEKINLIINQIKNAIYYLHENVGEVIIQNGSRMYVENIINAD